MRPSRKVRRSLERRADKLLERVRGEVVAVSRDSSPRECVLLLGERTPPIVVHRANVGPALLGLGADIGGLSEVFAEIAAHPLDDGLHYPALILIEGWLQVAFTRSHHLSAGGAA